MPRVTPIVINWYVPLANTLYTWKLKFNMNGHLDNITYPALRSGDTPVFNANLRNLDNLGNLYVITTPGAYVYVNNVWRATANSAGTAAVNYLDVGTHTVRLQKSGYVTRTESVLITSRQTTTLNATLVQTGTLSVSSTPTGAQLYVDGVYKGLTTRFVTNLAPGEHTVRLVKTGYQEHNTVATVNSGQTTTLAVTLTPQ